MSNAKDKNGSTCGLIVVSAPSGAGKSTLCGHLLNDLAAHLSLSISSTSRSPRGLKKTVKLIILSLLNNLKKILLKVILQSGLWCMEIIMER